MSTKNSKYPITLAETHWKWLETICHKMYVDAFIHGYKHGKESNNVYKK